MAIQRVAFLPINPVPPDPANVKDLHIPPVHQCQGNWCWAACGEMLTTVYNHPMTQCTFASNLSGLSCCPGCCKDCTVTDGCNIRCEFPNIQGVYKSAGVTCQSPVGKLTENELRAQLQAGSPVLLGFVNGGSSHVMLATGFGVDHMIFINDPHYQTGSCPYDQLPSHREYGDWTFSWTGFPAVSQTPSAAPAQVPQTAMMTGLPHTNNTKKPLMPLVIDTINSDERSKIGEALTIWIPSVTRGEDPMPISMGEILEIVNIHLQDIGPTGINKPDTKPLDPAYYVQLFSGRQARYFATVERTSNATEPWKVLSIFSAEVAAKVEVGMAWIDQLVSTPPVSVKLLQISSYLLTGLMLEWNDKTQVLLLDLPVSYDIPSFHLYSLKKIRDLLSKYPPSSGILISVPKPAPSETPLSKQP